MKAFIFAAGFGKRLIPITRDTPKPLVPVSGIPSICYAITVLKEAGINDVICNLHYRYKDILKFFKDNNNFDMNIEFSIEEEILGTGGGLKRCESFFSNETFVIINSDIITDIELTHLIESYNTTEHMGMLSLFRSSDPRSRSTVAVDGGSIIDFNNILNTEVDMEYDYMGIAVLSPVIFNYLEEGYSNIVNTGFTGIIKEHSLGFYEHRGLWEDIGSIESLDVIDVNMKNTGEKLLKRINEATGFFCRLDNS